MVCTMTDKKSDSADQHQPLALPSSTAAETEQQDAALLHPPVLRLEGYEGPLDLLLELARAQKVDLSRISVLQVVEQYLIVVEKVRHIRLELAADWLVMTAWLTWLKSRLLLPPESEQAAEGEEAAELLQARLRELACMNQLAQWLEARPHTGRDVWERGTAEDLTEIDRSGLVLDIPQLMSAYMSAMRRTVAKRPYAPPRPSFWTVKEALTRLTRLLGEAPPGWRSLEMFLPQALTGAVTRREELHRNRAAKASILIAGLELAKTGNLELRQDEMFGQILVRASQSAGSPVQPVTRSADDDL